MKHALLRKPGSASGRLSPAAPDAAPARRRWAVLWILLLALADTLVIEAFNHKLFTTGPLSMSRFISRYPLALAVDVLLVAITLLPALFLRRRVFWCAVWSVMWLAAGGVNGFILLNRMTPFTTADLTVLNTGLDTLPNYLSTGYLILLGAAVVIGTAALLLLAIKGPKSAETLRRRCLQGAAAMLLCAGALGSTWAMAFHVGDLSTVFSNLASAYEDFGFPYCFLQTWLNKGVHRPSDYGAAALERIRGEVEQNSSGQEARSAQTDVNVVFVQLESFLDPDEIDGLTLSADPIHTFHALKDAYTSGYLRVPVVGAGTANTEFEVLTGMSTRMFGPGEYPYKTCLQTQPAESLAYDLGALGYAAHAIHNHRATFYGRNVVYQNLGFDDFTSIEYMPLVMTTPKNWAKDYVLTSQILLALDQTEKQRDFVFTVSVQGHGKYPTEELLTDSAITVETCPANCNPIAVEYYVNQLHETDQFLQELVAALNRREERTVLVLYGDHLPSLNLKAEQLASGTLYKTDYVIWNNFGLPAEDENLYAYQLGAAALEKLDISQGFLTKFHQSCRNEPTYRMDLQTIQYDQLYGSNLLYAGAHPFSAGTLRMGAAPITVTGVVCQDDVWYVEGTHFSPYCQVTADGKLLKTTYQSAELLRIDQNPPANGAALYVSVVDPHRVILSDTE